MRFTQLEIFDFTCVCDRVFEHKMTKPSRAGHTTGLLTNQLHYQLLAMSNYQAKQATAEPQSVDEEVKGLRGIEGARKRAAVAAKRKPKVVIEAEQEREEEPELFIADLPIDSFRNELISFEWPLFSTKPKDTDIRSFQVGNLLVTVTPSVVGAANVHDKDLWIYCISHLVNAMQLGRPVGRWVQFTVADFLSTTQRGDGKKSYEGVQAMLLRLQGTIVTTREPDESGRLKEINNYRLIGDSKIVIGASQETVKVLLPDWLYDATKDMRVLVLDQEYFELRSPLARRIYELARKHCGQQQAWKIRTDLLLQKTGSTTTKKEFARLLRTIASEQTLPRYKLRIEQDGEMLVFSQKNEMKRLIAKAKGTGLLPPNAKK